MFPSMHVTYGFSVYSDHEQVCAKIAGPKPRVTKKMSRGSRHFWLETLWLRDEHSMDKVKLDMNKAYDWAESGF